MNGHLYGYCDCPNCGEDFYNVGPKFAHCEMCGYTQKMEEDLTVIPLKDGLIIIGFFAVVAGIISLIVWLL